MSADSRSGWYNNGLSRRTAIYVYVFLEIVELPDGRIELRRAEDEGSLVTLDFSEDAKVFLQGSMWKWPRPCSVWACRWPVA